MVRKYIRKTQRKLWTIDSMKLAIKAVVQENYSIRRACMEYKVPQSNLSRKVNQIRSEPEKDIDDLANSYATNLQTVFRREQEIELCQYIHALEDQFIPVNTMDIRQLAYQMAERFQISHPFNRNFGVAGEDWCRGFLKRNPEICVRKPDSNEKILGMRKEQVHKFFDLLENIVGKHQLEASDIYNLDETFITCSLKTNDDTSAVTEDTENSNSNNSKLVTATVCFSASGAFIPPMLIFPCSIKNEHVLDGAPPKAWAEFDKSGQMQLNIFISWLNKFIWFSKATKDSPVLLIVDGYRTYLKNLQVLELAKKNGLHILCLPSSCTENLQPMRQDFMKLLSTVYTTEVTQWTFSNPGDSVSIEEVYQLFGNAFEKTLKLGSPIDGFHSTGIWPVDRNRIEKEFGEVTEEGLIYQSLKSTSQEKIKLTNKEESIEDIISSISTISDTIANGHTEPTAVSKNIAREPIVVITQGSNQSYIVQSLGAVSPQNQILIQQSFIKPAAAQHYSIVNEKTTESVIRDNMTSEIQKIEDHQDEVCSAIIPSEAQLSEVQIEDIQNLIESQRKVHFYVSPFKLNLS